MKKVLLLVSILCLSSSAFSQQKRTNYLHYEMDAGREKLILVALQQYKMNAFLFDDDNFEKYKNGEAARPDVTTQTVMNPIVIVPPRKQHWHLVIDNGGKPFNVNIAVQLFSLDKDLSPKAP